MITSREPLGIAGEVTWRVEPLELHAAERLFLERVQAANNSLVLTDQHKPAVARIAVGLDGLPLAIELAAARARVLTVDQLAERLAINIDVLSQPRRIG
jgi:predicted ATPase